MQHRDETGADYLRRVVETINRENEFVLDQLVTPESVLDYVDVLDTYSASNLTDIGIAIETGSHDAGLYNEFLAKHDLRWRKYFPVDGETAYARLMKLALA